MAKVTTPNVCKMPGPPAPFVPTPLPNIGKSGNSPQDYSQTVEIEGNKVAIRGATFASIGDVASQGTGGGLISANTQGPTKFITPGSLTVKIEGKSVHLLGEPMLNNCAASGNPPNTGATMVGEDQSDEEKPKCTHANTKRDPPDDVAKKKPENQVKDMESRLRKDRKRADKLRDKLGHVALTKAAKIAGQLRGVEDNIRGLEAEIQVATDELNKGRLVETQVKIVCADCGITVTELDVITSDDDGNPVAKEVKAGADFDEGQAIAQTSAVATFFPGGSVHLAAPAAAMPEGSVTKGWAVKPQKQTH
jgi:hypothetical protein